MILGVCEWLSFKLGWKVSYIRIAFVIGILFAGLSLWSYPILWVIKVLSK